MHSRRRLKSIWQLGLVFHFEQNWHCGPGQNQPSSAVRREAEVCLALQNPRQRAVGELVFHFAILRCSSTVLEEDFRESRAHVGPRLEVQMLVLATESLGSRA